MKVARKLSTVVGVLLLLIVCADVFLRFYTSGTIPNDQYERAPTSMPVAGLSDVALAIAGCGLILAGRPSSST